MGILSWLGVRGREDKPARRRRLVRVGRDNPRVEEIKRAAAADVAAVEEDDKYFRPDSPGNQRGAL